MRKKKHAPEANLAFLAGLYTRVARQTGVHPSYVSRVARGERRSDRVSRAISNELAQFVPSQGVAKTRVASPATSSQEYRQRLIRRLKAHPQLEKVGTIFVEIEDWGMPKQVPQVSRVSLQSRIAENAPMMAASMEHFHRMSRKLRSFPYVLNLTDSEGVILYSVGAVERLQEERRIPGAHWGHDHVGPSAAARAIAACVPVIVIGNAQQNEGPLPVRMACPIRLEDGEVAGVVVLSIELSPARAEHLIEMAKMARKICKIVEDERKKPSRRHPRTAPQVNTERHGGNKRLRASSAKAPGA